MNIEWIGLLDMLSPSDLGLIVGSVIVIAFVVLKPKVLGNGKNPSNLFSPYMTVLVALSMSFTSIAGTVGGHYFLVNLQAVVEDYETAGLAEFVVEDPDLVSLRQILSQDNKDQRLPEIRHLSGLLHKRYGNDLLSTAEHLRVVTYVPGCFEKDGAGTYLHEYFWTYPLSEQSIDQTLKNHVEKAGAAGLKSDCPLINIRN